MLEPVDYDVLMEIVRREVYQVNKEYKITPDMFNQHGEYHFLVELPGKKFTNLNVGLPDGRVQIRQTRQFSGACKWEESP